MSTMINYDLEKDFFEGGALHTKGTIVLMVSGVLAEVKATPALLTSRARRRARQ